MNGTTTVDGSISGTGGGTNCYASGGGGSTRISSYQNMPQVLFKDGSASDDATVESYSDPIVNIDENVRQNVLHIQPNPANDHIQLAGITDETEVQIYTLTGELISSRTVEPKERIDVSTWVPGAYILHVGNTRLKFVVTH